MTKEQIHNIGNPLQKAWNLYLSGKYYQSLNLFNSNLKDFGSDPWYIHDRARVLIEVGGKTNTSQAVSDLERIRQQLPSDAQIAVSLAQAYGRAGDFQKSREQYQQANKLNPQNHEVLLMGPFDTQPRQRTHILHNKGMQEAKKGNYREALRYYEAAIAIGGDEAAVWSLHDRARILLIIGGKDNNEQAVDNLEKAVALLKSDPQISVSLAIASGRAGNYNRCADMYRIATTLDPKNHEVSLVGDLTGEPPVVARRLHDTGLSFFQKGNFREALRYYDLAVAIGGERAAVWSLHDKGVALMRLGDYEEAAKVLEKCQNLLPDSAIITLDLANVYESFAKNIHSQGKPVNYPAHDIAATYCQEVLLKDPQNIIARELMLKIDGVDIDRNIKVPINKKVIDGKTVWVDEKGNSLVRNFVREREIIRSYLSDLKQTDPEYYAYLESLSSVPTMHPMDDNCRVSVNIPAWMEGRNIYHLLDTYCKQQAEQGSTLDYRSYEINLIVNRQKGTLSDNSVAEIEKFIANRQARGEQIRINYIDAEFEPPFNNVGHARKVITDLTLLRSINRTAQGNSLYIESEDADLTHVDPKTIINIIKKMDANPHLDAVRGIQDRSPDILKDHDYLLLKRRIWDFGEAMLKSKKYRPENNPRWNAVWNRVVTGGWNTAYSAEAYALIEGYSNMTKGEDMDIGIRLTTMRGENNMHNLDVVGTVSTRSSSSPRRFIEELYSQQSAYGQSFEDPAVNERIKNSSISELMDKIKVTARISPTNASAFDRLINNALGFYRGVTPNELEARKLVNKLLFFLGFQKTDYEYLENGHIKVHNWENIKVLLDNYRTNFKPGTKLFEMNQN